MATTEKFSAKEAAIQIGTDARTLRKFIRSSNDFDAVGQGNRYEFTKSEIKALKKAFLAWSSGSKPKKDKKSIDDMTTEERSELADHLLRTEEGIEEQDEVDRTTEEVDLDDEGDPVEIDDLEGPSDDDLEEIELDLDD